MRGLCIIAGFELAGSWGWCWFTCFHLPNAGITGKPHHVQLCWGPNSAIPSCCVSTVPTELHLTALLFCKVFLENWIHILLNSTPQAGLKRYSSPTCASVRWWFQSAKVQKYYCCSLLELVSCPLSLWTALKTDLFLPCSCTLNLQWPRSCLCCSCCLAGRKHTIQEA